MLFNIVMRSAGVLLFGLLILFRVYLISHLFSSSHHYAPRPNASYESATQIDYRNASIAAAADSSGWVLFNSTDPQTGMRIRHARLTTASHIIADGQPGPPHVLELLKQGPGNHHIRLTLQAPASCPGITSVHAVFGHQAATLAAKPVDHEAGCTVELLDYDAIVPSLLDADVLTVSAGGGPDIRFDVAGLSWD